MIGVLVRPRPHHQIMSISYGIGDSDLEGSRHFSVLKPLNIANVGLSDKQYLVHFHSRHEGNIWASTIPKLVNDPIVATAPVSSGAALQEAGSQVVGKQGTICTPLDSLPELVLCHPQGKSFPVAR